MTASAVRARRPPLDGRLAVVVGLSFVTILGIGLIPTVLREGTRDWIAYDQAANRLVSGEPLYVFTLPTPDDEYYLYPPPTAALWAVFRSPELLLALKLAALAAVGGMVALVPDLSRRERIALGVILAGIALVALPDVHDLVLGNVMALFVGAVALSLARPGWLGSVPLGLVCAVALKPVIGPYLLWLFVCRRGDALRTVAAGLVASVVCAAIIGPGRYLEYLTALPRMTVLADLPTGNVGLTTISRELAVAGVVVAYVVTVVAAARLDLRRSAAVAVAAGLLAQPTIGFNYAGLLIPAVVVLWTGDRVAGLAACLVVPLTTIVSPPLAAVEIIVLAFSGLRDRLGAQRRQSFSDSAALP